jgi:hypothetical protein
MRPEPEPRAAVPVLQAASRAATVGLAGVTAALGASLLPFWPPALIAAIAISAAAAAAFRPRLALAIALAAPVFPLGNEARGAALLYTGFALAWLALTWTDARRGLLFAVGPLLAPFGALALVPLAVQPSRSLARKGAQAATAILAAALVAGTSANAVPFSGGETPRLRVAPADTVSDAALAVAQAVAGVPLLIAAVVVAGVAAALLPEARSRSRYGVGAIGLAVSVAAAAGGSPLVAMPLVLVVWGVAALLAARPPR